MFVNDTEDIGMKLPYSIFKLNHRILTLVGLVVFSSSVWSIDPKTYINPKAFELRDIVMEEIETHWPELVEYNYIPALINHESCITDTHSRCWSPTSELRTSRELGQGLGQITVAYNEDGSVRFDTLKEMKARFVEELKELSRENITSRPDLQIRAIVLHVMNDYKNLYEFNDPMVRLHSSDASYSGGRGSVNYSRRACGLVKGCDTQQWFDHVELHNNKSTKPLYAGRSARDIFMNHPRDVFFNRLPKYQAQYFNEEYLSSLKEEELPIEEEVEEIVPEVVEPEEEIIVEEETSEETIEEPEVESVTTTEEVNCSLWSKIKNWWKDTIKFYLGDNQWSS